MKNKTLHTVAATLFLVALAGCSPKDESKAEAPVAAGNVTLTAAQRERLHVQAVKLSTFHRIIETSGTVGFDSDHATTVLAPISGPVSRLSVNLGTQVKAGDPLALVDSPDYATAINGYRKAVVTAKNLRRIADLDKQLFESDALARRDLEQAQADAINSEADRDAAMQQLHSIGVPDETLRDIQEDKPVTSIAGVIRSPLSGTVVEKLITPGQLLQAGTTPCFTVADLSQVWVVADIFESQLASVAIGDNAEVLTGASADSLSGTVDNISAMLDPNTRSIGVRIVAKNPDGLLKKQMYVRVRIHSSRESNGLLAPVAAILRDDENLPFVYLLQPDNSFARRQITLGSRIGDHYEIAAGLKDGDQLVTNGGLFVQFQQNQ